MRVEVINTILAYNLNDRTDILPRNFIHCVVLMDSLFFIFIVEIGDGHYFCLESSAQGSIVIVSKVCWYSTSTPNTALARYDASIFLPSSVLQRILLFLNVISSPESTKAVNEVLETPCRRVRRSPAHWNHFFSEMRGFEKGSCIRIVNACVKREAEQHKLKTTKHRNLNFLELSRLGLYG